MSKNFTLGLVLVIGLVHGAIYVFLIPPWQHYDEPSHFEYVWMLATKGGVLDMSTGDLEFRRKLVQSMIANGFFRGVPVPTSETIELNTQVYGLEYSQLDEPPAYYFLAALSVRLLTGRNPAIQLIGARIVSLGLLLFTLVAIWGISQEITRPNSSLRLWVPLSVALLPGFVELMTAVNNDVGAVAAFSLFLWCSLRLLNRKISYGTIVGVLGSAMLCGGMKSSVYVAIPLSVIVVILGFAQGKRKIWVWSCVVLLGLVGFFVLLTWQDAAYWHRGTSQSLPTREKIDIAPLGDYALSIDSSALSTPKWLGALQQPLNVPQNRKLTLGVWIWVSGNSQTSVEILTPILRTEKSFFFETITVNSVPQFFSFETSLPSDASRLWLSLAPGQHDDKQIVYYDGFILAEGTYSLEKPPRFDDDRGLSGTWGGVRFQNLIQNPSAESVWPSIQPTFDTHLSAITPNNLRGSTLVFGVLDWVRTGWYFRATLNNMLETFWGRFGWGHIPLVPAEWYKFLGLLSVTGIIGFIWGTGRRIWAWDKKTVFLFLAIGFVWGVAILRGEIFIFTSRIFIPGARYAYPTISITLLMGLIGWREGGRLLLHLLPLQSIDQRLLANIIGTLFFLILDFASFYSVLIYYGS